MKWFYLCAIQFKVYTIIPTIINTDAIINKFFIDFFSRGILCSTGFSILSIACLVEKENGVARFLLKNKYFGRKTVMNVMGKLDELEIAYKF